MRHNKSVIIKNTVGIVIVILLLTILALGSGCTTSGANIRLHGMSLGAVTMGGKPVEGLPSDKIDILLEVSAKEIRVEYTANTSTILTLSPSEGTVEITASGVIINGIKPEKIKVEWALSEQK
jgi:hypothetical protein